VQRSVEQFYRHTWDSLAAVLGSRLSNHTAKTPLGSASAAVVAGEHQGDVRENGKKKEGTTTKKRSTRKSRSDPIESPSDPEEKDAGEEHNVESLSESHTAASLRFHPFMMRLRMASAVDIRAPAAEISEESETRGQRGNDLAAAAFDFVFRPSSYLPVLALYVSSLCFCVALLCLY